MKIAIVTPAHPFRGGIAASSERLAQQFMDEGHEVRIYNFTLQYPSFLFPGKTQKTTDSAPENLVIEPCINSVNPITWWRAGRRIRRWRPELIVVRYWLPFMAPALGTVCRVARKSGAKVICVADNIIPHEKRPGDTLLTRYMCRSVDGFVTLSREVYDDVALFVREPHRRYTPHPIYDHYGAAMPREEALRLLGLPSGRYLLFFGFIRDYKGLDLLLEALAQPLLDQPDLKLIVAGEFYGNEERYTRLIHDLHLESRVIVHCEYIPNDQINRYFCAADLLVQPYKTATQSGVTQIGYAFDKPMLVTNVGGLPEIVDHNRSGYVVGPTPKAIAEAIADFYAAHRAETFIRETHIRRQRYSWHEMTKVLGGLFDEIKGASKNQE